MIRLDYVTNKSKSCSLNVAIKPKLVSVISVLCLSFGNENETCMCHDLLMYVHGYSNDIRAKSRKLLC
ncbi:BTB/POZ domain-containing 10 [Gossypium arboreum]|uniref:BTB/POZ domain-containing 10 n=1 Tax=Gossypium arboreum TaxID=29729 RepID=A0A0B0NG33_GOSAR|nr:BTB/POZ domain-containing 10 [Gossypium arboreum]